MLEKLIHMLDALSEDVNYFFCGKTLQITLRDFDGFDDEWNEIMRGYTNERGVYDLLNWLEQNCELCEDLYYTIYRFPGFDVEVGYSSMDI